MPCQPIECELQHDLAGAGRPVPVALHVGEALEEAAHVEQQTGELRPDRVERVAHALPRAEHGLRRIRGRGAARRPRATAALQFEVMRGMSWARVNSARSRSPAWNCAGSMSARPSRPLRRASQASGLSAWSTVTRAAPGLGLERALAEIEMPRAKALDAGALGELTGGRRRGEPAHGSTGADEPAPQRRAGAFEGGEQGFDRRIVATVLDQPAGVRGGGAIAAEGAADLAEAQPEHDVREIHRALPGECGIGRPAGARGEFTERQRKRRRGRKRCDIAEALGGARTGPAAGGPERPGRRRRKRDGMQGRPPIGLYPI